MRRQIPKWLVAAAISLLLVVGLSRLVPSAKTPQPNTTLRVSAAASLQNVLAEIQPLYQRSQPNVTLSYNLAASGLLQQQIEQGAAVDLFISAGQSQMDSLEQKGLLVSGSRQILARNRLVLVVPKLPGAITGFNQLTDPRVKRVAIGDPRSVPAGQYAQQVLKKLGIEAQIKPKLVLASSVRQVLAAVESGNADAGWVYATDARITNKVNVVATANEDDHSPIVYPVAILKSSRNADVAQTLLQFLSSDAAKAVLRQDGFIVP